MGRNNTILRAAYLIGSCMYFIVAIVYIYLMLKNMQVNNMTEFIVCGVFGTVILAASIHHLCDFIELRFKKMNKYNFEISVEVSDD